MALLDTVLDLIGRRIAERLEAPASGYETFSPSDPDTLARTLQPADVLLVEGNQRLATAIKYLTQSTWSHAALYAGDLIGKEVGSDEAGLTRLNEAVETLTAYEVEYRLIWPDGSLHWINSRGSASYAPDGTALKMVGVTLDITERKRGEEHLRMLVAELDHRVKNVLATVSAVTSRTQEAAGSVADFVAAPDGRIQSMAKTHQLLSSHLW
jgi:HWE histidine kinase/PAS fold